MSYYIKLRVFSYLALIIAGLATISFASSYSLGLGSQLISGPLLFTSVFFVIFSILIYVGGLSFNSLTSIAFSAIALSLAILMLLLSSLPAIARDELNQHLALPKLYLLQNAIVELPYASYSYYPMLINMLYVPFIKLGFESGTKLLQVAFALSTAALVSAYIMQNLSKIYGILGAIIFLSTPIVFRTATTAYVDLALTFYSTAAILCLVQYRADKKLSWLILLVLLLGVCAASKPNGGIILIIVGLLWFFYELRDAIKGKNHLIAGLLIFTFLSTLFCLPWFIRNYILTTNPFFPFLNSFFGPQEVLIGNSIEKKPSIDGLSWRFLIYGENIWQVLALPIRIFLFGKDDSPREFDGILNPILILFLPFVFRHRRNESILMVFSLVYLIAAIFLAVMRVRYIMPILPFMSIFAVFGIHNLVNKSRAAKGLTIVAVFFCLAMNGDYIFTYFNKYSPNKFLQGKETRQEFLTRVLPDYAAVRYVNENTPQGSKIYLILTGRQGYHLDRDYFFDSVELPETISSSLKNNITGASILLEQLHNHQITHLIIRNDLFLRFVNDNLDLKELEQWRYFSSNFLKLCFNDGRYSVYELIYSLNRE